MAFQVGEQYFNLFSITASQRAPGTTLHPGYRPVPKIGIINDNYGACEGDAVDTRQIGVIGPNVRLLIRRSRIVVNSALAIRPVARGSSGNVGAGFRRVIRLGTTRARAS